MASIFKRGKKGTWWIKYYVTGQQVYHSLNTTEKRVATQIKRQIEGDEAKGDLIAPTKTPLPEFMEDFCKFLSTIRTSKSYKNDVSSLRVIFGLICPSLEPGSCVNKHLESTEHKPVAEKKKYRHIQVKYLEEITPAKIEDFISRRIRKEGIAPKTANRHREVLHRMFSYAIKKWNFVALDRKNPNPVAVVERRREPARTIRFLKLDDIQKQLSALKGNSTIHAMVATYIYVGIRREELLWLTTEDVDINGRLIHIRAKKINGEFWQPKTKQNRVVPISNALFEILVSYNRPFPKSLWFFPSTQGCRWDPDNFSPDLRKINKTNGLEWSCLDFRHTFGSHLAQKGESLYKIATLMGNSPEICRKHYAV
jgi:integrase